MRRRGAGDGACPSRRLGSAGAASRRMRRLARRQQGEQHRQGGAALRAGRQGFPQGARRRCTNCRCPASSTGTSIISWCWRASTATASTSTIPRSAARRIDMAELDLAFTGVVLAMEPTEAFRKVGQQAAGPAAAAARDCAARRPRSACWSCVSFALIVPGIVAAGFSKIFVDDILIRHADRLARAAADRHGGDRAVPRRPDAGCASRCCCGCKPSLRWS